MTYFAAHSETAADVSSIIKRILIINKLNQIILRTKYKKSRFYTMEMEPQWNDLKAIKKKLLNVLITLVHVIFLDYLSKLLSHSK